MNFKLIRSTSKFRCGFEFELKKHVLSLREQCQYRKLVFLWNQILYDYHSRCVTKRKASRVDPLDKKRTTRSAIPACRVGKRGKANASPYLAILNVDSPRDACSSRCLAYWLLHSRKDEESILNQFPIDCDHTSVATLSTR